jgi:hypothetical protein
MFGVWILVVRRRLGCVADILGGEEGAKGWVCCLSMAELGAGGTIRSELCAGVALQLVTCLSSRDSYRDGQSS